MLYFVLAAVLCIMGMRGTISHPIRQGDAFYCNNPLLNQVGLNPVFTIFKSYTSKVNLMDDEQAITHTQELLQIRNPLISYSPIAREVKNDLPVKKPNIIIVLMESMSANYMQTFGNKNKLTPTLDSLAGASWFFKNAYSSGIHTNNGVFSVLYSFPALKRIRPMSTTPTRTYSGLPYILKQNGYKNLFFSTHDKMFDNLANFIPGNFFDKLYTSENYPADKIIGPYGVPDDYLFSYATQIINQLDSTQPFFVTILTTSNHDPYIIPDYYKSTITEKDLKAVSYADWSINKFLTNAKTQRWFDNTIFVFVSDHGLNVGKNPYEMALSYNHIPIIMHAPKLLGEAKVLDNFIGQIDIFPTLMGMLNFNYINNTLGTDVLSNKRECIYFSADDKLGCLDEEYLFIYTFGGNESLYKYKAGDTKNYSAENKPELEKLKNYSFAQTQVAQWIYTSNKSSIIKSKE